MKGSVAVTHSLFSSAAQWPGVDPQWLHRLEVCSTSAVDAGQRRSWSYLDNLPTLEKNSLEPVGTILAVHGNPTWSYIWRNILQAGAHPENRWRVIAVDQLDMGYSERTGTVRRLEDRVQDLSDFTKTIGLDDSTQPVVTLAHDWGGLVSLGWALEHQNILSGILLTNTAVFHAEGSAIPAPLQVALAPGVHRWGTQKSTAFLDVTLSLVGQNRLSQQVRAAYRSPYTSSNLREGIRNFVADIPATPQSPSYAMMQNIAEGIRHLQVPAFFQWGVQDPVFTRRYLADLMRRMPHADVHCYENSSHLVMEDQDVATPFFEWLHEHFMQEHTLRQQHVQRRAKNVHSKSFVPMGAQLEQRREEKTLAVVDMHPKDSTRIARHYTWAELAQNVERVANGLEELGVRPQSRVNLMIPPGALLTTCMYACLKIGAIVVVADTGLGAKGLTRALKGARPDYLIGIPQALAAAKAFGWPGSRISAEPLTGVMKKVLGVRATLTDFTDTSVRPRPIRDAQEHAAVLYTSGSTGPAKGVLYTQQQLSAMRDAIMSTYHLHQNTGLVAGFAPFALLGPALGVTSVTPTMDVTQPKTLTASALAHAVEAISAQTVFLSPAALMNVVRTSAALGEQEKHALAQVRTVLSAGAPLSTSLLEAVHAILPHASIHTPYGMTEALPITDISYEQIQDAAADAASKNVLGAGNGVCVGTPIAGAQVSIAPLDKNGVAGVEHHQTPGVTGEILVRAPHVKDRYDRLWVTEHQSIATPGWHHTGDVGHLDEHGRLWVEGRLSHIILGAQGIYTPVAAEHTAEKIMGVRRAAVVPVGPAGCAQAVAVVETDPQTRKNGLASVKLTQKIRNQVFEETGISLCAVLAVKEHPTDIRHNSKIDRTLLAQWAEKVLSGEKAKVSW